ncbi:MAG: hypothetical protein MZV63_58900 [Marinilabiliales bacterium]|nr:hypothetical protein [Marinilabiliales bacterium]
MDDDAGLGVLYDPDVREPAVPVLHVLETALLVIPGLDALIGHPVLVLGDPRGPVADAAPEDQLDGGAGEADDDVRVLVDRPQPVPARIVLQLGVISAEPPRVLFDGRKAARSDVGLQAGGAGGALLDRGGRQGAVIDGHLVQDAVQTEKGGQRAAGPVDVGGLLRPGDHPQEVAGPRVGDGARDPVRGDRASR